jgi:hypothetical protein
MRTQCNRYCHKCCSRTGDESFPNQQSGSCYSCQVRRSAPHDIAIDDSIHLIIRIKPSMTVEKAALQTAKGLPINPANLPTPDNVKSYITSCLKRYQQAHNLPEDTLKVSDTKCPPISGESRLPGDAYHHHSCGLSNSSCKKLQDYQTQIMLLEQQNKRRLQMARQEPDTGSTVTKQPIETPTPQEVKFRHYKLQDYQRQLMCEAMQAKKEQLTTSVPDQANCISPTHSAPQGSLNEQTMKNLSLEEYQKQPLALNCGGHKDRLKFPRPTTEPPPRVMDASRLPKQDAPLAGVQQAYTPAGAPSMPPPMPQCALTIPASAGYPKNRTAAHQQRNPIQDYNMQLMLLEQQNRKRLMLARGDQQKLADADARSAQESEQAIEMGLVPGVQVNSGDKSALHKNALTDYQMQLMLLEQQRKKALLLARSNQQESAVGGAPNTQECKQMVEMGSAVGLQMDAREKRSKSDTPKTALTDYQMQLMLLEQQGKKRCMTAKLESEQQNTAVRAAPNAEESEQIMEMGLALGTQRDIHDKGNVSVTNEVDPAQPGALVVRQVANAVKWIAFEYSWNGIKMEYTIRCDTESVNFDYLSPEFRTENCVYPGACVPTKEYNGKRLLYEMECNTLGWALACLNPCLRNKRGLIRRAVDSWRNSNQLVVYSDDEDEEDAAMWSTDEFDEWSNCDDDVETAEELKL